MTLQQQIIGLLARQNSLSDRQITDHLLGSHQAQQPVHQSCRKLEKAGVLQRVKVTGSPITNVLLPEAQGQPTDRQAVLPVAPAALSEEAINAAIRTWLAAQGWSVTSYCSGKERGIDIVARQAEQPWIIEVKGSGKTAQVEQNYMYGNLGQLLFKMNDLSARYSVAFPDKPKFVRLWERLPQLAKQRLNITVLFVNEQGEVREVSA